MPIDFNSDNLDLYLKNRLSEVERQAMEQKIAQDPLLESEFRFQQEVVDALCQRRKWELKQRLDALAPESAPFFTLPRLAFGGTLAIAGLLTVTLFWFDSKKAAQAPKRESKNVVKYAEGKQDHASATKGKEKPSEVLSKEQKQSLVAPRITQTVTFAVTKKVDNPVVLAEVAAQKANNVVAPCLPAETPNTISAQDAMVQAYEKAIWFEVNNTDTDNGAYDRSSEDEHQLERAASSQLIRYQYYNGQLSLYNNASLGKQLHTVIEGTNRHFLLYEGVYYEFFDGQMYETVMQPLRDKSVLREVQSMFAQLGQ